MTSITYDDIYSRFLVSVNAYEVSSMLEDDARVLLSEWLHSVRAIPKVRKIFSSIVLDGELQKITYELKNSFTADDEETNNDFVIEVFGLGIAWRWSSQKYKSTLNTNQVYSGKEEKYYSQANHTDSLKEMQNVSKIDLYNLISQHVTANNSYLTQEES